MIGSDLILRLTVALAAGLLIGLERGWEERNTAEGFRIAGIRTFALLSILGAMWALLAEELGTILLGFAIVSVAIIIITAHVISANKTADYGITTVIAAMVTFTLGAAAMRGYLNFVATVAILSAVILGIKTTLHKWIQLLEKQELYAIFQMLLISVVLLPVLPDRGFGPWQALNPYQIWWMVVLITGISFSGYFAIRILGPEHGLRLVGLFGGLVSSTALTLNFSRIGREHKALHRVLSVGILIAAGTMFPRTLLLVWILFPPLVTGLLVPLGVMMLICFIASGLLWKGDDIASEPEKYLKNPFEIKTALQFGVLLAAIMLMANALHAWLGDAGIYILAGISGIMDIDPVTLSMSSMAREGLIIEVATRAIVIAAIVNTFVKGLLSATIARGQMARDIGIVLLIVIAFGCASLFFI